jgi:hypothetical protein
MEDVWRESVWRQFGAALEMLENAVRACPGELWGGRGAGPEFWYVVYHTLFFTDLYLSGSAEGFAPPEPYTLDELDPAGLMPGRVYAKDEMLEYLRHCREKCRATVRGMTVGRARALCVFGWGEVSFAELLLYNMRHAQHHAGQLNLMLRRETGAAPGWVCAAKG